MARPLQIAVADAEPLMRHWYQETLSQLGHELVVAASDGNELMEQCRSKRPEMLITDIAMPGIDGLAAAEMLCHDRPMPIILVSAQHEAADIERALKNHVLAYLIKPIKQADLAMAITLARRRFDEFRALEQQADRLAKSLSERKLIERAKGILMHRVGLSEPDAFKRLQRISQNKNQKMADAALTVIAAEEVFSPD
ncbi:MAG: ANTAR domain-containing response regulator [Novipirellula sp. JB048]